MRRTNHGRVIEPLAGSLCRMGAFLEAVGRRLYERYQESP